MKIVRLGKHCKRQKLYSFKRCRRKRIETTRPTSNVHEGEQVCPTFSVGLSHLSDIDEMVSKQCAVAEATSTLFMPTTPVAPTDGVLSLLESDLLQLGWIEWHASLLGGNKTQLNATALLHRLSRCLFAVHTIALRRGVSLQPNLTMCDFFFSCVTDRHIQQAMVLYFEDYPHAHSTLAVHLYSFMEAVRWLQSLDNPPEGFTVRVEPFIQQLMMLAKGAKKRVRKARKEQDNSIEHAVFIGRYPPGGMAQIRSVAQKDAEDLYRMFSAPIAPDMTKALFKRVLQVTINTVTSMPCLVATL
jgi:hypothetical protein